MDQIKSKLAEDFWVQKWLSWSEDLSMERFEKHGTRSTINFEINHQVSEKVADVANRKPLGEMVIYLAFFQILLQRYFPMGRVVTTIPGTGKNSELLFFSTVFGDLDVIKVALRNVAEEVKEAIANQNYKQIDFWNSLNAWSLSKDSLLSYGFVDEKVHLKPEGLEQAGLVLVRKKDHRQFELNFEKGRYSVELIERMSKHFKRLLDHLFDSDQSLAEMSILTPDEQKLIDKFSFCTGEYTKGATLNSLFELQAMKKPEYPAVYFEDKLLTYRQLNEKANQMARFLKKELQVKKGQVVGMLLGRGEQVAVVLLGILKAGATYLPIKAETPKVRLQHMIENSALEVLLVDKPEKELCIPDVPGVRSVPLDQIWIDLPNHKFENLDLNMSEDVAQVLYTSGSTGNPKGVVLRHQGVVNRIEWMWKHYGFNKSDIIFQKTPLIFDVSVWEFFMPLAHGASIVMCREDVIYDPKALCEHIEKYQITMLHFVPGVYQFFLEAMDAEKRHQCSSLRQIWNTGEALLPAVVDAHYKVFDIPLHNLYGPTEAGEVSYHETQRGTEKIPIGRPIQNVGLHVLDTHLQPVPVGVAGEIAISGLALADGYLNQPDLTNEKFVKSPSGQRIYRTGDFGQWDENGEIHFLGRMDHQVKLNGYRIELGEIENVLISHEAIKQSVVLKAGHSKASYLVAFYTGNLLPERELLDFLSSQLPSHMLPARVIWLVEFPISPTGKINKRALPEVEIASYQAPQTEIERGIVAIWEEVLTVDKIGIHDNFFQVGGQSLKAVKVLNRTFKEFGIEVLLKNFFRNPTVAFMASQKANGIARIPKTSVKEQYPLSSAQNRIWAQNSITDRKEMFNLPFAYRINGNLNIEAFRATLVEVVKRHDILRTVFVTVNGSPQQKVLEFEDLNFQLDYQEKSSERGESLLREQINQHSNFVFDLKVGPLIKADLIEIDVSKHVFLLNMHHIISDGWSMAIVFNELLQNYLEYQKYGKIEAIPLRIQYKDYSAWYESKMLLERPELAKFWHEKLASMKERVLLPLDFVRPTQSSSKGAQYTWVLDKKLVNQLRQLCLEEKLTMYVPMLSGFYMLLYGFSGQRNLVIGSPVSGRTHPDLETQVGFYINTLPLFTTIDPEETVKQYIQRLNREVLNAMDHQSYPLEWMLEDRKQLHPNQSGPLFDCGFTWNNFTLEKIEHGLEIEPLAGDFQAAKADLWCYANEMEHGIAITMEFNTDLFNQETINQLSERFNEILFDLSNRRDESVGHFGPQERASNGAQLSDAFKIDLI